MPFLGPALGYLTAQCAARGGEIWLHLTGMICPWAGNLTANFWKMSNPHPHALPPPLPPTGFTLTGALASGFSWETANRKPQTAKCRVTTALRSSLQFAVHVWTAGRVSSGNWFTARFFATKNCTASRLKEWTSFLYPFEMCLLDFWSRINELLLIFGD